MNSEQQLVRLSALPLNKTVVFYSPVEGKDVLVRTGVLTEGSSFMHALLHGYSKDYIKMNKDERINLSDKIKKSLSDKLDRQRWENVTNGLVAKIPFQDNISEVLADFYRHVLKERSCKTKGCKNVVEKVINGKTDKETYQILCELLSLEKLDREILASAYDSCSDKSLEKSKKIILKTCETNILKVLDTLGASVDSKKKQFCVEKFISLIEAVLKESDDVSYKAYLKTVKDVSFEVDAYTVGLLSERLNRDIYFLDSKTRMPYLVETGEENIKKRKSVIVLWLGGLQYEIVGRLLSGNRIQRDFEKDDPLIKRIYTFLYRPDAVHSHYPNLVPYLSNKSKKKLGLLKSGSEHDSQSKSASTEHDSQSESEHDSQSNSSNSESEHESNSGSESNSVSESSTSSKNTPKKEPQSNMKKESRYVPRSESETSKTRSKSPQEKPKPKPEHNRHSRHRRT